ncbi:copper homeostasis protein CutC [Microbacterium luticocti]|uniref:copper homeostasis protein CutC n=1 Tax=Microbacterium luticocti TaxID=451764 RepID=UPI000400A454|nr:copper homeostasis protein CutC [Microbacterium luticocti]
MTPATEPAARPAVEIAVEIAVQDPAGARAACGAGADRVELCQALGTGGLTPSIGTVEQTIAAVGADRIAPLVRPRGGGFVYDADEVAVVAADIRRLSEMGVAALVVGCLTRTGTVDLDALARWRDAAAGTPLVFHRAVDVAPDPTALIDPLIEAGVVRVLTSGGAARSIDGVAVLRALVHRAAGRIEIMAGGGIRTADMPDIVRTGVDAVHLSARAAAADAAPSGPGGGADAHDVTDPALVHSAVTAVHSAVAAVRDAHARA